MLSEVPNQGQGGGSEEDSSDEEPERQTKIFEEDDDGPTGAMPPAPPPSGAEPAVTGGNPFADDPALGLDAGDPFEGHDKEEEEEEEEGLDESLVDQIGSMSMAHAPPTVDGAGGPDGHNPFEANVDADTVVGGTIKSAVGGDGRYGTGHSPLCQIPCTSEWFINKVLVVSPNPLSHNRDMM